MMTWLEAAAALASGTPVRRQEWVDGWILTQEGERLVLRKPLPGLAHAGKHESGNIRFKLRSNAGRTYSPSTEAMKAVDWEVAP